MKKIYLVVILALVSIAAQSQNDTLTKHKDSVRPQSKFKIKLNVRAAYIFPNGVGDNVIAKANEGKFGVGFKINFIEFHNINFGAGVDFLKYEVTDASLAGNIRNTNISFVYAEFMYRIPVIDKLTVYPKIAFGETTIQQRTGSQLYGSQTGFGMAGGVNIDYEIAKGLEIFTGLTYGYTKVGVNTNSEYEDFYGKINQFNIALGLKINIVNYPKW